MEDWLTQVTPASLFELFTKFTAAQTLIRQFQSQFVPEIVHKYIASKLQQWIKQPVEDKFTLLIKLYDNEDDAYNTYNPLYQACHAYLSSKIRPKATRLKGIRTRSAQNPIAYCLREGETFVETVENEGQGFDVTWQFQCKNDKDKNNNVDDGYGHGRGGKYFELTCDPTYKTDVLDRFLPLVVLKFYDHLNEIKKEIYLYTLEERSWRSVKFNHPFTFDSLALDPEFKKTIIDDLDMFIRRKAYYNKVGKAWKRGYLLYGPPGTGKSSLVAAMANYLRFDIYDFQLGAVTSDATLRKLMLGTTNRSILVIEDIDCTTGLSLSRTARKTNDEDSDDDDHCSSDEETEQSNPEEKTSGYSETISFSGLLNFIDGLWSSCGDERIIIFTTNHKDRLDPALLRPGRMDMHIHMSYLTMNGFKVLANNYLGLSGEHPMFKEIELLLKSTDVTAAEVAEELIRIEGADLALSGLVDMLRKKSKKCPKIKKGGNKRKRKTINKCATKRKRRI